MDFAALYDDDIETWAEVQVEALRRLAARPGPWSNVIDWDNVIEEVESLGSERRRAAESLLQATFVHLLKLQADPTSLAAEHWRSEVKAFLKKARSRAARSMRNRIDLDELWRSSLEEAENRLSVHDRRLPDDTRRECPFTFDQLIDDGFDPLTDLRFLVGARARRP